MFHLMRAAVELDLAGARAGRWRSAALRSVPESGTVMTPRRLVAIHHAAAGNGDGAGDEKRGEGEYGERSWSCLLRLGGAGDERIGARLGWRAIDRAFLSPAASWLHTYEVSPRCSRSARQAVAAWVDDYAPSMGAALAYYTLFSVAPLLLIVISIAGLVFGPDAARGQIFAELRELMGDDGAAAVAGAAAERQQAGAGRRRQRSSASSRCWPRRDRRCSASCRTRSTASGARRAAPAASGLLDAGARAAALVRHGPRRRLPAHRLARRQRRRRRARQVLRRRCSAAGSSLAELLNLVDQLRASSRRPSR